MLIASASVTIGQGDRSIRNLQPDTRSIQPQLISFPRLPNPAMSRKLIASRWHAHRRYVGYVGSFQRGPPLPLPLYPSIPSARVHAIALHLEPAISHLSSYKQCSPRPWAPPPGSTSEVKSLLPHSLAALQRIRICASLQLFFRCNLFKHSYSSSRAAIADSISCGGLWLWFSTAVSLASISKGSNYVPEMPESLEIKKV